MILGGELLPQRINGHHLYTRQFDSVMAQLAKFEPNAIDPLVLEFGLTGVHVLEGAGLGDDPDDFYPQPSSPVKIEKYRGGQINRNQEEIYDRTFFAEIACL
jgi:hypothetical protein